MKLQFCYGSKTAPCQGLKLEVSFEEGLIFSFFFSLFDKPEFEWLDYLVAGGVSSLKGKEHTCDTCGMLFESTRRYTLHNNWVSGQFPAFTTRIIGS